MFQKVTIIGNLGGEPDTRYLQSGTSVCSFSVATNRKWTNSDGSKGEETVWWRVSAWGKLGEICQQYLNKGQLVLIEGQITPDRETGNPRVWTDNNGQARASFEIRADTMKMLGRGGDDTGSYDGGYNQSSDYAPQQSNRQAAPAQQQRPQAAPQRAAPARSSAPQPAPQNNRRSTTSAPAPSGGYDDEDFSPDEIPF